MDSHTRSAFEQLMARVGLSEADTGGQVNFTGADPVLPSRLRYGAATASAIATQAAGIATIWKMRSGRGQDVSVDLARSVHLGLRTVQNMRDFDGPVWCVNPKYAGQELHGRPCYASVADLPGAPIVGGAEAQRPDPAG